MGTIAEKLNYLMESKILIEDAIKAKGVTIGPNTPFRELSNKIATIEVGTGGNPGGSTVPGAASGTGTGCGTAEAAAAFNDAVVESIKVCACSSSHF